MTVAGSANDTVSGAVAVTFSPASGSTFPLGTNTVTASATDPSGNATTGSFTVTVRDTTAPVITGLTASPAVLWPPNHKMVSVSVSGTAAEAVSPVTGRILSVTSNEPDNGLGDGDTAGDIVITSAGTMSLRAERGTKGNGRIYTILFQVSDAAGNTSTKTVTVTVPKNGPDYDKDHGRKHDDDDDKRGDKDDDRKGDRDDDNNKSKDNKKK